MSCVEHGNTMIHSDFAILGTLIQSNLCEKYLNHTKYEAVLFSPRSVFVLDDVLDDAIYVPDIPDF